MPEVSEEEDDFVDGLEPIGSLDDDDEGLDEDVLGLALDDAGPESVGLDDSAGLDDPAVFELELPRDEDVDGGDGDLDAIPIADDLDDAEEYGWTEGSASASDDRWEDLDLPSLAPIGRDDDGGAEGVEEVFDHSGAREDDALPGLPALAADLDLDDDEGIDLDLDLPEPLGVDEAALPPRLDGVRVEVLIAAPTFDVVRADGSTWAATAAGVFREGTRCAGIGLEGTPSSVCRAGGVVLVGTDSGVFRSSDDGASFARVEALGAGPLHLVAEAHGAVWCRGPTGRLQRSEDGGLTWSPPLLLTKVAVLAAPRWGVVTLSAPEAARPQLASSEDGGARWAANDAPPLERPPGPLGHSLAASGPYVALASAADPGGPFLSRDRGRTWVRVPGLPAVEALALGEDGELVLYASHPLTEGSAIARHVPDRDAGSALLLEGAGVVYRLVVDGGDVLAATARGLLRLVGGSAR